MQKFNNEVEQKFSLRKYTIGLCSVCLGFVTIGMGSQTVKADTVNNVEKSSVMQENRKQDAAPSNTVASTEAKANTPDSATAKPNITPTETKENEVGSVATTAPKTNTTSNGVKANTADSANSTKTKPTKANSTVANSNNVSAQAQSTKAESVVQPKVSATSTEAKLNEPGSAVVKPNVTSKEAKPNIADSATSTEIKPQETRLAKTVNTKVLAESKVATDNQFDFDDWTTQVVAKQTAINTLNTTNKQTASIKALADNKTEKQATGDFRKDGLPTNEEMTKSNQLVANSNADYTNFVDGKPETVTLSDGSTLTFSKDVIHSDDGKENDIEVTFESNSFKAGDVYQFKFANYFLPLKQGSLENLPSALGTTTSTLDDSNIRTITDTFTSTGSITQKFHVSAANFEDLRRDGHEVDYLISKLLIAVTKNNQPDQSGAIYLQRGKVGNGSIRNPQDAINLRNGTYIDGEKYHVTYRPIVYLWNANLKDKQTDFDLSLPDEFQVEPSSFQLTDKTGTPITDSKILSAFKWQSLGNNTYRLSFSNLPDNDVINQINYGGYKVAFDATLHANGKTTLTDKNGNGISVQLHEHQYNTKEPVYDSPVYKVLDPLKVATKASANPLIYWTPIYKNIPQSTKKYPSTGFSNNQNGNLIGGHVFNYDVMTNLTNAKLTLNIPDGFNLYSFDSQEKGKVKSMDVIFADGTRTTVQNSASFAGDNNKAIRQIVYYFNNIDSSGLYSPSSDDLTFLKADKFELATNYANGNLVEPKDKLTISGNLSSDQFVNSATMNFDVITVDDPVNHTIKESAGAWAGPNQTSSAPNQEGGDIGITFAPWDNTCVKLDNPVFYIQYNNLMSPELDKISVPNPNGGKAEYKAELLDNHMIKVSVTGEYYYESHGLFAFHLPFMNTTDATNSEKPVTIYIYDGKNGTRGDKITYGTAHASSKVIDGIHMDLEGTGTWNINVASGFTVDPGSITNTTASPVKDGKQDVHRDHADQFDLTYSLVNSKSTEKNNLVDVVNLPGTWDGKSGFNVALDAQPYLIDVSTGERIDPSKYTIEYSNDRSQNKFTDSFSNDVQAIRIRYGLTMPVTASWRLVVPVKDDHVYDHEGKTLHLSDLLYGADENTDSGDFTQENGYYVPKNTAIKPYLITADSSASATVAVGGISHVKTYVHYQDANGTDHLVELPDQAKTFDEGVDTISRDKFITSLSDADKALLPAQMVLDYNNPTVKLADNKFLDGYTTGDFKLGDKATYYTDGMQVIFEGKLPINVTNDHKVTITVHKKQEKLENNQVVTVDLPDQTFDKTLTISGQKNPFTGDVKWDSDKTTGTIHIDIPDIDGYSKNEASRDVNIDMNSKDSVINVLYKLPRHTITYIYLAPDGKGSTYRYGSPVVVTGVPNQSLDAHLTAPDGYVFADPQQAMAKSVIGKDDQTIFIDLKNTYHAGNTDAKTIDRTINYLDDEDHSKAVASPVVQHGILKRVEVVDNTGKVLGYGTVIDDGEGYTLSDAYVPTTNWDEVVSPDLTKQGYEPASVAKVDAAVLTGDTQPATVDVYYKHHLVSVDINSHDKHGVSDDQLTRQVSQTVHFVYEDGTKVQDDNVQDRTFNRTLTVDAVNGKVIDNGEYTTDWMLADGEQPTFDAVNAPVVKGYFADKAKVDTADVGTDNLTQTITYHRLGHIIVVDKDDNQIVGADSPQFANDESDATKAKAINAPVVTNYHLVNGQPSVVQPTTDLSKDVKVVYAKDQGRVKVIFADDTTGNSLTGVGFDSGDADFNTPITYTTDNDLAKLASEGYDYVSTDGTLPKTVAGKTNTTITVHVKHGTTAIDENHPFSKYTKDDLQKTAKQTINYVDDNGNQLLNSITHTVTFNATGTVDKVTGNLVNVDNNGKIIDQNGKLNWTFASDGNSPKQGDSYSFDAIPAQRTILKDDKTYRFEKTDPVGVGTNGGVNAVTVTAEKPANQTVNVVYHLVTYHAGNIETKTVDRTINYLDDEDHTKSVSALVTQHGQLARMQILDDQGNVIGYGTVNQDGTSYTINNDYVPVKNWDAVVSPDLSSRGYEPASIAKVDALNLTQATQPTTVNVYYKHHLVSVDVNSKDKHGVSDDQLTKTVHETVHFVNGQGQKLRDDNTQTRTFNRTLTVDATDNHVIDNGKFTTDWKLADNSKDTYDNVDTPVIKGYFADAKGVGSATVIQDNIDKTVNYHKLGNIIPVDKAGKAIVGVPPVQFENDDTDPTKAKATSVPSITNWHTDGTTAVTPTGDLSKNIKVTYNKDQGSFKVIFTDDITGKTINGVGTNITADFDTPITYNIDDDIKKLTDDGYEYDSTDGKVPNKITANESTTVTVHLKHKTESVTRNDTVTRTIHYLYDNGNTAQPDKTQTVSFNETGIKDDVTGDTTWSDDNAQTVDSVITPSIIGYTPDKSSIEGQAFKFGDKDVEVTVRYSANEQTATITYIDDTTKTNLDSKDAKGKFGQAITFEHDPAAKIASYEKQGYVLVSNSFDNNKYQADDNNNVFYVHL
ncbi:YSIRK-type signal peptide-containing protein, partial [Lactobacillus johnsonii]|uniref:mucin-binding protein n=1 Tax=Lactobacillus johnsonii TaxID=33959 RepID=UPI0014760FD9